MVALFKIIKKNFKLLIRSKSSALVIILGPLLVIFLVGIAFDNTSQYSLKIGTYSESYSELSDSLIKRLTDKDFKVNRFENPESCIDSVKKGNSHACIVFPKGLKIISGKSQEIEFNIDYSKINLVYVILDTLSSGVGEQTSELSMDMTSTLLKKIDDAKKGLYEVKPMLVNLKTVNNGIVSKGSEASNNAVLLTQTSSELRQYFLDKAKNSQKDIEDIKNRVKNSNASDSQKDYLDKLLIGVNTYMLNIESRIEDPNDQYDNDWISLAENINQISAKVNEIKSDLDSTNPKIDNVQSKIDSIYNNLGSISVTDAGTIVNPLQTTIKPVVAEKTYLNYLFPALIVLVVMFISIVLSNTLVMMEKHSPAYFRNFITPTRNITFVLATYLTNVILVIVQIAIIISISYYFFDAQIAQTLKVSLPILFLITSFFTFVGMFIGYIFTSEETSTLASICTGSVFLFLSSVILPLESMPLYVQKIAVYNPFVLSETLLRKAIIFKAGFSDLVPEAYYLLGASVVLFCVIWGYQKFTRRHLVHHMKYLAHKTLTKYKKNKKKK